MLFEELQDDPKSLFSCLMINSLWCEVGIPVLWKNPWCYENNIIYRNKSSLYNIITSYLPDDVKEYLTSQGIQLSCQTLLFDYLYFCRSMNVKVINDIISIGISFSACNQFFLQQEIYTLFMNKFPELKYLDMRSNEHQIFYFPEAKTRLDSLCELTCDASIHYAYFYGLSYICNNIEKLIIFNTSSEGNYGIIRLIEVQGNLKYFEWNDCEDFDPFDIYEEIFLTLTKKADTLTHFITNFQESCEFTFPSRILSEFHNLKTLKLNFHSIFDYSYDEQLKESGFPNLEILQLNDFTLISTVSCIIKNSGGHLRKILVNNYDFSEDNFAEESFILIDAVYKNCPLIEYLSLAFPSSDEHFVEFEKLLKVCQHLKVLGLSISNIEEISNSHEEISAGREKLLKALIRSASINLREIKFFEQHFKFSLETLEDFLENWRGRPALTIFMYASGYEEKEYTGIINKYKDEGVIKDFRFVGTKELMYF
ncbi:hypothetical protein C1645_812141 [Glomus cerebriforme]|uniref:F-box domain-containing protein n=1 Tax=Glomus cerebriforme TaxID=658196 RepID=A0A397TVR8_9GLOM|nr:hypothetical protein C1645_812141 [Glomus cerebriforme]